MAVIILLFGSVVEQIAMPALAGLLIIVGVRTVKVDRIKAVVRAWSSRNGLYSTKSAPMTSADTATARISSIS